MLTEEERSRIREIEQEKLIAQKEYKSKIKLSKWQSFKNFISSSFGLWVLSTILITVGWSSWLQYRVDLKEHEIREEKLNQEISHRLAFLKEYINHCTESPDTCKPVNIFKFIAQPTSADNSFNSIFSEFQERGLISLISEQHSVVPKSEKEEIKSSLVKISEIVKKYEDNKNTIKKASLIKLLESCKEDNANNFFLSRWQPLYNLY